jgi:hypothetical protein
MREVKYSRGNAYFSLSFGLTVLAGSTYALVLDFANLFFARVFMLSGAIIVQISRSRLQAKDVLLRLTPDMVWTKEFGWQPWEKLEVELKDKGKYGGLTLEIHRPNEFTPRFLESIDSLDIDEEELRQWL